MTIPIRQYKFLNYTTNTYGFAFALPLDYATSGAKKYPLVIQLHGIGEAGYGNTVAELEKVCVYGPLKEMANGRVLPEAIYVQPQATILPPKTSAAFWFKSVDKLITQLSVMYRVDPKRIYLMGLSAGATVVWQTMNGYGGPGLSASPNRLAAIVPICGQYLNSDPVANPLNPDNLKGGKQIWAFHAFDDTAVPLSNSVKWINAICQVAGGPTVSVLANYPGAATGKAWTSSYQGLTNHWNWYEGINPGYEGAPKLTIYPNGGHGGGWSPTFASQHMWTWLFARSLP